MREMRGRKGDEGGRGKDGGREGGEGKGRKRGERESDERESKAQLTKDGSAPR